MGNMGLYHSIYRGYEPTYNWIWGPPCKHPFVCPKDDPEFPFKQSEMA